MKKIFIKYICFFAKFYAFISVAFFTLLVLSITIPGVGILTLTTFYSVIDGIKETEDICATRNKN